MIAQATQPAPFKWHYARHEHGKVIEETLDAPMHPEILRNMRWHHTVIETPLYDIAALHAMYCSGAYVEAV